MQNVLKRKNVYFDEKNLRNMFIKTCFMFQTILDLMISNKHIKKKKKKNPQKLDFTVRRGGGAQNVTDRSVTFRFLTPSLTFHSLRKQPPPPQTPTRTHASNNTISLTQNLFSSLIVYNVQHLLHCLLHSYVTKKNIKSR